MNVEELKTFYEEQTNKIWEIEEGIRWLQQNYEKLSIYIKTPALSKTAHTTLSDKAAWLGQQFCRICNTTSSIKNFPVRIQPESWQSIKSVDKQAFKQAIRERFAGETPILGKICLSYLFVCSKKRRVRDLDNMTKLLTDSIKGVLMGDDKEVDHLSVMRLIHDDAEEYVYIRISNSNLNDHSDTVLKEIRHSWAGAEPILLPSSPKHNRS